MKSRFSAKYAFEKPNDRRALDLMNAAAKAVLSELPDIVIAYGISDEYRLLYCPMHFLMHFSDVELALYSINLAFYLRDGKGITPHSCPVHRRISDGKPANWSQRLYQLLRLILFISGALTSPAHPSHLHCQVLMGGPCCIPLCRT